MHRFYCATLRVSAVFAVVRRPSVCLSVRLSVTLVYCIHKAQDIVKLLSRLGSAIILVFFRFLRLSTEFAVYLGNGAR